MVEQAKPRETWLTATTEAIHLQETRRGEHSLIFRNCKGYTYARMCLHLRQLQRHAERKGWRFGTIAQHT